MAYFIQVDDRRRGKQPEAEGDLNNETVIESRDMSSEKQRFESVIDDRVLTIQGLVQMYRG